MTWTAPEVTRAREPAIADERTTLEGLLDSQRGTLMMKCAGLSGEQLARQNCPPSKLSLLGLVRHMTDVERIWFRTRFGGEAIERTYWREERPDAAFLDADPAAAEADFAALASEIEAARNAVADVSLDTSVTHPRFGELSLRWLYGHMIREYARHNGHADLIRERIDGRTGF